MFWGEEGLQKGDHLRAVGQVHEEVLAVPDDLPQRLATRLPRHLRQLPQLCAVRRSLLLERLKWGGIV